MEIPCPRFVGSCFRLARPYYPIATRRRIRIRGELPDLRIVQLPMQVWSLWQLVTFPQRFSTAPLHNAVESLEVRPLLAVRKEFGRFERRDFLCHCRRDKLIDTRSILPAESLNRLFERTR